MLNNPFPWCLADRIPRKALAGRDCGLKIAAASPPWCAWVPPTHHQHLLHTTLRCLSKSAHVVHSSAVFSSPYKASCQAPNKPISLHLHSNHPLTQLLFPHLTAEDTEAQRGSILFKNCTSQKQQSRQRLRQLVHQILRPTVNYPDIPLFLVLMPKETGLRSHRQ